MMLLKVTATMLVDLLNGKFTEEACEAICRYYEDTDGEPPYIGDIAISFSEIPAVACDDYFDVLEVLENGNAVVFNY